VLHALVRRGGIWHASKTKINNLETNELAKNPPFSKIWFTFWRERWILKKSKNLEFLKTVLNSGSVVFYRVITG